MLKAEELRIKEDACFKATPVKTPVAPSMMDFKSDKKVTQAIGMSLVSDKRSVKREEFEAIMREKERSLAEEKETLELERQYAEEEEVRKIRASSNFKATPIKHYKVALGAVPERKLTVPVEPKFETGKRAALRQDLNDDLNEWADKTDKLCIMLLINLKYPKLSLVKKKKLKLLLIFK